MADIDDPAQSEDQGGESGDSPYADYLNRIPEEVRGDVEPIFKEWDSNTTRRFQEASEYRKGWEPFEELGVQKRDPAEVQWAMQFVDALANPTAIQEWYKQYAEERGLTPQEQQAQDDSYIDPSVQQLVEKELASHLGPVARELEELRNWRSGQEQQRAQAEERSKIENQLDELKAKHPDEFNRPMVEKLIANHVQTDPKNAVQLAFSDWQAIRSQLEKDFLQGKADVPAGTLSGGTPDTAAEPIDSLKRASEVALEQLRGTNRT